MKKRLFLLTLILCVFCTMPVLAAEFTDIDGHWSQDNIEYITDKGLIKGYPDGTFLPNGQITRAEFVVILARESQISLDKYTEDTPFPDVNQHWAKDAILWASENGVVDGYSDGTFLPDGAITRQELAVMFYRYLDKVKKDLPEAVIEPTPFTDDEQIGEWAKVAVQYLQKAAILDGYEDDSFRPQNPITRGETAKIMAYYLGKPNIPGNDGTNIYVNGKLVKTDVFTETVNGVDMIQVRPYLEAMGYQVSFYSTTKLLVADSDDQDMQCWIGKANAYINGTEVIFATTPRLVNESTMVPIDTVASALKVSIEKKNWGGNGQILSITCPLPSIVRSTNQFYGKADSKTDVSGLLSLRFNDKKDGYYGQVTNGVLSYGSYTTETGQRYIGNWSKGMMSGTGRYISTLGELYIGTFAEGHITKGTGYFTDGSSFTGEWYFNAKYSVSYPSVGQFTDNQGKTYGDASSDWSNGGLAQSKW